MAIKFTTEFVERRMAEHKRWQHDYEREWIEAIIDEVQQLPFRRPRSGQLFELVDVHEATPRNKARGHRL